MKDDRAEFAAHARRQSEALGEDAGCLRASMELISKLDRYDYPYLWTWMGVPIIQFPADVMATQEVIWSTRPDIIIETGVARGGSVIFMASILAALGGQGRVIGIDIEIRPHNRETLDAHPMRSRIDLIEGSSIEVATVEKVKALIPKGARVMVVLDSNHARDHVLEECRLYGALVTEGCFLVVADTVLGHMKDEEVPTKRSQVLYRGNEPLAARDAYLAETDRFEIAAEVNGKLCFSSSPGGYLRCIKP